MLSLAPPFLDVGGVTLLPDHADPLVWYYVNLRPRVSVDAAGTKQLRLTKYRHGTGITGGLLDFSVDLGLDAAEEAVLKQKVAAYLRDRGVKGTPEVVPATAVSGSAHVMMFGDSSRPKAAGAAAAPTSFVKASAYPTSPSLAGANRAIFSIALDGPGSSLVERTLGAAPGDLAPVGVLYELAFEGLRPAYRVSIDAKWDVVHERLSKSFKGNLLWLGGDIETTVDKLIEKQDIEIVVEDYGSTAAGQAERKAATDAAVGEVRRHILTTFFKPAPPAEAPREKTAWEQAGTLVETTARAASTFGLSTWGSFTWSNIDVKEAHERAFALSMNERTTVRQTFYPCAHLTDLASTVANRAALVRSVDVGEDVFFKTRQLAFAVDVDLTAQHISHVVVEARYGDDVRTVPLTPTAGQALTQAEVPGGWAARGASGTMQRDVDVDYTVYFRRGAGTDTAHLPPQLHGATRTVDGNHHTLAVSELFTVQTVTFEADHGFPWSDYKAVEIHCRPEDRGAAIADDVIVLRATEKLKAWKLFRPDTTTTAYRYRLVVITTTGERIAVPRPPAGATSPAYHTSHLPFVAIDDPRSETRSITLLPRVDWEVYDLVEVTLFGGGQRRAETITFHAEEAKKRDITLRRAADATGEVEYAVAFYRVGQDLPLRLPRATLSRSLLTISPGMKGTRHLAVRTAADGFARAKLAGVDVRVGGRTLAFQRGGEQQQAEIPVEVGGTTTLRWSAVYRYADGLTYEPDAFDLHDTTTTLEIPLLPFPA